MKAPVPVRASLSKWSCILAQYQRAGERDRLRKWVCVPAHTWSPLGLVVPPPLSVCWDDICVSCKVFLLFWPGVHLYFPVTCSRPEWLIHCKIAGRNHLDFLAGTHLSPSSKCLLRNLRYNGSMKKGSIPLFNTSVQPPYPNPAKSPTGLALPAFTFFTP